MPIPVPKTPSPTLESVPLKPTEVVVDTNPHGDFRDQLFRDGWAVVPDVIPAERTRSYVDAGHAWLESFGLGYKRDDPSTWQASQLPYSNKGGLYSKYAAGHEQYAWDIRQEPKIIEAFAKIWGTDQLLCSMDAVNLSVPLSQTDEKNADVFKPWPHHDQSPTRPWLHCIQGIANLAPNGPDDGGLMVLDGSSQHYAELFQKFAHLRPQEGWPSADWYPSQPAMLDWLINEKGCKWHKVCAPEGSLILWDSRTIHYGSPPLKKVARIATYVCYKPASLITPDRLAVRVAAFNNLQTTTHDPILFRVQPKEEPELNDPGWKVRQQPDQRPVLTERGKQLVGLVPY